MPQGNTKVEFHIAEILQKFPIYSKCWEDRIKGINRQILPTQKQTLKGREKAQRTKDTVPLPLPPPSLSYTYIIR